MQSCCAKGFTLFCFISSAAICSSCRTTRLHQLSVSQMEKQDEKMNRTGESVAAGYKLLTSTYNTGPDGFVVGPKTHETTEK